MKEPLKVKLCDDDGIVRKGALHHGTDYPCTGSAHFGGSFFRCSTPVHETGTVTMTRIDPLADLRERAEEAEREAFQAGEYIKDLHALLAEEKPVVRDFELSAPPRSWSALIHNLIVHPVAAFGWFFGWAWAERLHTWHHEKHDDEWRRGWK